MCANLLVQLVAHFRERGCRVFPAPFDVRLPVADEHDDAIATVVQPDISSGDFGAPELLEARGVMTSATFFGLAVDWDEVFADVSPEP